MKRVLDLPLNRNNVLLRVDFNVPIGPDGQILDDTRLKASQATIKYLLDKNCNVILLSHLGRPQGYDPELSLQKVIPNLEKILGRHVTFIKTPEEAVDLIQQSKQPEVFLLENLRFNSAEENPKIDPSFAKSLAKLGDYYVNDAFACAHRAHSSITELAKYFPSKCAAGFLMAHEIEQLSKVLDPKHPFYLVLGGSKISTKIGIIESLLPKCESLFIGGAMAFPFMKALNISMGACKIEDEQILQAKKILEQAKLKNKTIHLPLDWKCKIDLKSDEPIKDFKAASGIPSPYQPYDIGNETVLKWSKILEDAKTIFWNGPLGMYEVSPFDQSTIQIAQKISKISCDSIVGGGDTVAALEQKHIAQGFSHISTGGGASLEFLEKSSLPGVDCLN